MGNSKKPNRPELRIGYDGTVEKLDIECPEAKKVLAKEVPAKIHWSQIPNVEREDSEVIGKTLVYEDGTFDLICDFEIMSEEAKVLMGYYQQVGPYSIGEQGVN